MAQTSVRTAARQSQHAVSAQAHTRIAGVQRQHAACRSHNRMHVQKALMEYLLLGRQPG